MGLKNSSGRKKRRLMTKKEYWNGYINVNGVKRSRRWYDSKNHRHH